MKNSKLIRKNVLTAIFVLMVAVLFNPASAAPSNQNFDGAPLGDTGTQSYTLDNVTYTTNDAGALNIQIVNDGNIASGGDLALGYRSSGVNQNTQVTFRTLDESEFKLNSFVISTGLGDTSVTIKGYRNNTEIASSSVTTGSFTTFNVLGDSSWENIDEVRITGSDLDIDIDDIYFSPAVLPAYNVTYNGNGNTGGSVPTDNNSYNAGNTVTVLNNTGNLEKNDYSFTCWNTVANGTGNNYNGGDTFAMGSSNMTLYAQWTAAPVASFTSGITTGTAPLTVSFTDTSINSPTSWLWDFGDGTNSTDRNTTHTYTNAGLYTVSLTATSVAGSNTSTQVDYINVTGYLATSVNSSHTSVNYYENDNMTVDPGINVTGSSNFTSARVYIGNGYIEGEDFLRFTNTSSINGSFDTSTAILSLSGSGDASAYQEAFRNVRYENINDNPSTSDRLITFVMGDNAVYLESTGHYYESVHSESAITWTDAKAAAEARNLSGMQGYLATIISEDESVFLGSKAPDNAWMGANDAAVEEEWRWVTGPENLTGEGTLFYYQGNGTTLPGFYTNWNANEPNDHESVEDYGQILGNSVEKKWNDLSNTADVYYYLVEYGGMPNETEPQLTSRITLHINPVNDAPSIPGNFTSPLPEQSVERGSTINVSWGESTDPENDSLLYDLWFYNETWTQVANALNASSYMFTIPSDNISAATFKVYANDSADNSSENNVTFNLMSIAPYIDFTADINSGSAPLTVNFTDLSSHYPTGWEWDFGDGNISTDQNPTHTYYGSGTYNVSLNVSNPGGYNTSIQTAYITAAYVPVASFSSNVTSGDVPLSVSFADESSNSPTSWLWDFGDGSNSTSQNPVHTYASVGTYTVSLNASNIGGSNVSIQTSYITAAETPVANFSANITSGAVPLSVSFTDLSTNSPTSWLWDFGDGSNSTSQNPVHTYNSAGMYTISLNTSNVGGSNVSVQTNYITVAVAPVTSFSSNVTSGAVPLSVNFSDQSSNSPTSWFWDFGDGSNSTSQNPVHTYDSAGTYTVSLNASNVGGSNVSTQTNYITAAETPVANFTANITSGAVPLSVSFTDLSTNYPTSWLWDFGDGTNSTDQNATHTYTSAGGYNVSLNATNIGGSNVSTQISYIITDVVPVANFTSDITSGAVPLSVNFTDKSTNATSWYWEFGDGNISSLQNPSHTYTNIGTYNVSLNAINAISGNDTHNKTSYVTVAIAPVANFTVDVTSGTAPFSASFTDLSTNSPVEWEWDFGDGTTSDIQNPTHTYTDVGTYNVSLNASNAGGYNVSTELAYITVSAANSSSSGSNSGTRVSVSPGQTPEKVTSTYTAVSHVLSGSSIKYDLSGSGGPVTEISFVSRDNKGIVVAKVQVLSNRPEGTSTPPGNSYQVMSIDVGSRGTISSSNADNILIHFKVSRQWIEENNIDPATIRMEHYNEDKWEELPTERENEDDEYIYFVAETPGFSIFSVVGDEVKEVSEVAEPTPQEVAEKPEPIATEDKKTPGFTATLVLIFVSVAFMASKRFRK